MACKSRPSGAVHDPAEWPSRHAPPALDPGEIHVWSTPLDLPVDEHAVLVSPLTGEERARSRRLVTTEAQTRFAAARGALRLLLGAYTDVAPGSLTFGAEAAGKPYLEDAPRLRFSLAHSEALALVGVTWDFELGVDVERSRLVPDASALAARYLEAAEARALAELPADEHSQAFLRSWTLKEAVLKATGEGLSRALDSFRVTVGPDDPARLMALDGLHGPAEAWTLQELAPAPGYLGALAAKAPTCRLRRFTLRLAGG